MDTHSLPLYRLTPRRNLALWCAVLLLCGGAALRFGMLARDVRFHADEALYASFARRIVTHGDFLLADAPLDKPPLHLFLTAGSFALLGSTEFAARIPTVFASLFTVAVVYALMVELFHNPMWAVATALFFAISPFDLSFSATAFLDPLMTLFLFAALLASVRDRWRMAGICFILAIGVKQSALFFLPLILALGLAQNVTAQDHWRDWLKRVVRFALPVLIGAALLGLWSAARNAPVDFWTLGAYNNNPGRLIRANEVIPRLDRWLNLSTYITGFSPSLWFMVIPLISLPFQFRDRKPDHRALFAVLVISIYVLATMLMYWLVAFNTYDRYLHPLVPLCIILISVGAMRLSRWAMVLVLILTILFTIQALTGNLPIGGDHGQNSGIDALAAEINQLPVGTTVQHYDLGWQLGFYLGEPAKEGNGNSLNRAVFQPSPEALIRSVCLTGGTGGYFAGGSEIVGAWLNTFQQHGLTVYQIPLQKAGNIQLYRLECPH